MMLGRVLVVENAIPYAQEVCQKLTHIGCEALTVLDQTTIRKASKNADQYKKTILRAVQSALKRGCFDTIVVNLHLKDEDGGLLDDGDFLGDEVLRYVAENHPGICCIAWTAYPPQRYAEFAGRYDLADVVYKIPPRTDALCKSVVKTLIQGHPVRRMIGTRRYELDGINSQIYRFLHNRGIMSRVFSSIEDYDNRLIRVLGGGLDEPVGEAIRLMADLWHLEPGLPRYPLINELGEMEFGRAFWEEHRDHLIHQLLVYLLGLYLYYGSDRLKEAINAEMSEEEFLRAWKVAALFHDLGHVFEAEFEKRGKVYKQVFAELNKLRKRCLYHYSAVRGLSVLAVEDREVRSQAKIFVQEVEEDDIHSLTYFGGEDLFLLLEPQAQKVRLGETQDSLRGYWEYAMTKTVDDDKRHYVDHGIAGALVLLQQYRSLQYYIENALPVLKKLKKAKKSKRTVTSRPTVELITKLANQIPAYQPAIEVAASAIALHNISVDNWNHDDAFNSKSLTLHLYRLSLKESPFAFFLALVDALQSWDRPKYRMPKGPDYVIQAQDIAIGFMNGKSYVTYKSDEYRGRPLSMFAQTFEKMSHYMHSGDLKTLVEEGPDPDIAALSATL